MFNLGASEIVVIIVVALAFLGPKKLTEMTRASHQCQTISLDNHSSWRWSDWVLLSAVVALGLAAGALGAAR